MTLKHDLSRTLHGGEPALSYFNPCKLLAMASSAVNKSPAALQSQANNFAFLTENWMPVEGRPGAPVEHPDDLDEQRLREREHQRDHLNTWWNQQEHIGLRPLSRLKKVRGHASLKVG